jgi:hypothetical protein
MCGSQRQPIMIIEPFSNASIINGIPVASPDPATAEGGLVVVGGRGDLVEPRVRLGCW